ncbi:MAG: helix-turn-helix transcriptional regulator [Vibrionaceae bacterium]|nr:helix-turn-helix transcriptional regulator [Vibrionaceae bacterium]
MKRKLERVPQRIGASWRYIKIVEPHKSYDWHCHQEYEIAIHRNFLGSCFVGNYNSEIQNNHMILIGPGLPHAIYSDSVINNSQCETHVIWFQKSWIELLIHHCQELTPLREILQKANQGLQFSAQTGEQVVKLLSDVPELPPQNQFAILIEIFCLLIADNNTVRLINPTINASNKEQKRVDDKIESAEAYLLTHFNENISLNDLANHLFLSESSVRRLFSQHFNESFSQRLKKIRLNIACDMLAYTDFPIRVILEKVGYINQANFNRQFKIYKHVTPKEYRLAMKRYQKSSK